MIKNVMMQRKIAGYKFYQRTDNGFFNAAQIMRQYNAKQEDWHDRVNHGKFLVDAGEYDRFKEEMGEDTKAYFTTNTGIWMHPYLFARFVKWLEPNLKVKALKLAFDSTVTTRHNAGDNYKVLGQALKKLGNADFGEVAISINKIVFGKHFKGIRNTATPEQLVELSEVEAKLAYILDNELVKSYRELKRFISDMYFAKWVNV